MSGASASTLDGRVRVLAPTLCSAADVAAEKFAKGLLAGLPTGSLDYPSRDTELRPPGRDDVVVVFIPTTEACRWRPSVATHLASARDAGSDIFPIALYPSQKPPSPITDLAPLSVPEIIKSYHLGRHQFREAGSVAARIALSRLWPTYSREHLSLFLSHRRSDGEDLVRRLSSAVYDLSHRPARDLADIRPGTRIATRIVEELDESDVFVLCDTPHAADHQEWLNDELCVALGLGLPIVWIRFGQRGSRSALRFAPADQPDLDVPWPKKGDYRSIAAKLVKMAFEAGRSQVRRVEACIANAQEAAKVEILDGRRRIMMVSRDRSFGPFAVKERVLIQAFARRPTRQDGEVLKDWLQAQQLRSADGRLQSFDLGVLMGPAPVCNRGMGGGSAPVDEAGGLFYTHTATVTTALSHPTGARATDPHPELLLFAAFGPGRGARQEFRDAVQDVATVWLSRSGRIRFGGHPTVTPSVHWVARSLTPGREQEVVTVYQSRYFDTPELGLEVSQIAEVVETDLVPGADEDETRRSSLTLMRTEMITTSSAVAAIIIGGLTQEERPGLPGVQEEFLLARARGIPTFVLGATGGQAAVIAESARRSSPPFADLGNSLSADDNEFVATTDDYGRAVTMIWQATVGS